MAIPETPGKMYALAGVLSLLSVVAVILRFYSRRLLKITKIEMDDYMILSALVCPIPWSLDESYNQTPIVFHAGYRHLHGRR